MKESSLTKFLLLTVAIVTFSSAYASEECLQLQGNWHGVCSIDEDATYEASMEITQVECETVSLNKINYEFKKLRAKVYEGDPVSVANNSSMHWHDKGKNLVITDIYYASYLDLENKQYDNKVQFEKSTLSIKNDVLLLKNQSYEVRMNGLDISPAKKVYKNFSCKYKRKI